MVPALKLAAVAVVVAGGVTAGITQRRHAAVAVMPAVASSPSLPRASATSDDDLLQRAQDAYVHGEYDEAIELGHQVMPQNPAKAWRIVGASSCFKQDADGASAAWNALDDHGKKVIEYVCKRNQVTLPDGKPVL